MSSAADLLPSNSTPLERGLAEAGSVRDLDPDVIRTLWNADTCPPQFLPYLAWSLSVDFWEMATTEAQRRDLIRGAIQWHRKRGTPWAIKQALAAFGIERLTLDEHPEGAHWAEFDAEISVFDRPLSEATYQQVTRLIEAYKPERSHLRNLLISVATSGVFKAACTTFAGDVVSIHPYQLTELAASPMKPSAGIGGHDWGFTTIYPRPL